VSERQPEAISFSKSESAQPGTVPDVTPAGESRAGYDAVAREYATMNETAPYNALYERPAVIGLLGEVATKRVLDVGCGSGVLSRHLVEHGAQVVGFDASPAMVEIATARQLPNAEFRVADLAEPLSFIPDASFDLAVASLVMHYLHDWIAPLRELRRVLRNDGALVLSTHHPAWDVELSRDGDYFATEHVQDRWSLGTTTFDVQFWRRPLTAMFSAFAAAGLTVEVVQEPMPIEECRDLHPDVWAWLTTKPGFIFFRLRPGNTPAIA
jgi:SAM-dependent methyltransferase